MKRILLTLTACCRWSSVAVAQADRAGRGRRLPHSAVQPAGGRHRDDHVRAPDRRHQRNLRRERIPRRAPGPVAWPQGSEFVLDVRRRRSRSRSAPNTKLTVGGVAPGTATVRILPRQRFVPSTTSSPGESLPTSSPAPPSPSSALPWTPTVCVAGTITAVDRTAQTVAANAYLMPQLVVRTPLALLAWSGAGRPGRRRLDWRRSSPAASSGSAPGAPGRPAAAPARRGSPGPAGWPAGRLRHRRRRHSHLVGARLRSHDDQWTPADADRGDDHHQSEHDLRGQP